MYNAGLGMYWKRSAQENEISGFKVYCWLNVSKSQKQILKFSFETKNKRKYFCTFALASKMDQMKKLIGHYHAN